MNLKRESIWFFRITPGSLLVRVLSSFVRSFFLTLSSHGCLHFQLFIFQKWWFFFWEECAKATKLKYFDQYEHTFGPRNANSTLAAKERKRVRMCREMMRSRRERTRADEKLERATWLLSINTEPEVGWERRDCWVRNTFQSSGSDDDLKIVASLHFRKIRILPSFSLTFFNPTFYRIFLLAGKVFLLLSEQVLLLLW